MNILEHVEIVHDAEATQRLNERVRERMPTLPRNATHLSDLLYCLLKAWGKKHIPEADWTNIGADDDDPLLMWLQGLQFEDLVAEGQRQRATALCFQCRAVSVAARDVQGREVDHCPACGSLWLVATPDYIVDGAVYESKQTRKSQRRGPLDAPWWIEQLASYVLFEKLRNPARSQSILDKLVVNWIMGDYGEKRKGYRPRPPRSTLEVLGVRFPDDPQFWQGWFEELLRRQQIVDGDERPELSLPGSSDVDVPRYGWECPSCSVGKALGCPNWVWDDDDRDLRIPTEEEKEDEPKRRRPRRSVSEAGESDSKAAAGDDGEGSKDVREVNAQPSSGRGGRGVRNTSEANEGGSI